MRKNICTFEKKAVLLRCKSLRKIIMKTNPEIIESPILDASRAGGSQEYLTADELMQRLEPHIRSLFR